MDCKYCHNKIEKFNVSEITQKRVTAHYKDGKPSVGDKLITKHVKNFKCPTCSHTITKNKQTALKMLNK